MRWKTFHRDYAEHAQAGNDGQRTSYAGPQTLPTANLVAPSFAISGDSAHPSAAVLRPADAVLDTRDIEEALLREDNESHSQARTEFEKAILALGSSPSFSTSAAASPYIGLPAPPRGPKKSPPSKSSRSARQEESSTSRSIDAVSVRETPMDAQRSSPSSPAGAVSSPTDGSVPSIKDFVFGSGPSLRADVMNALSE